MIVGLGNFGLLCGIAGIVFKELDYAHKTLDEVNYLMNEDVTMMDRSKTVEQHTDVLVILMMRMCKLPGMLHCMPTREEKIYYNFTQWIETWG